MKHRWALGIIGAWLTFCVAGCGNNIGSQAYESYLSSFNGVHCETLRASWGEPVSVLEDGQQYQMVFLGETEKTVMTSPAIYEPYFDGRSVHHRLVQPSRWSRTTLRCETTFTLENDTVVAWRFSGDGCYAPNGRPDSYGSDATKNLPNAI